MNKGKVIGVALIGLGGAAAGTGAYFMFGKKNKESKDVVMNSTKETEEEVTPNEEEAK